MRRSDHDVRDLLGDPDALARAAGIVDPEALKHARQAVGRIADAEEALRRAYRERDEAIRAAAAANPDASAGTLARQLGLKVSTVRAVLRSPMTAVKARFFSSFVGFRLIVVRVL